MAPRQPITPPPATPPRYSLVVVASDAELTPDALYGGWKFNPELCGPARGGVVEVDCLGSFSEAVDHPGNPGEVTGTPFVVWASDECSTVGNAARDWIGRATRALRATESYWLARELSVGEFGLDQMSLNDASGDEVLGGAATEAAVALAALEEELGEQMRGQRGMVHVTEAVLVLLAASGAIRWDGTTWVTPMGNLVVADAGYVGAAPGETTATAGESWIYGTSLIRVGLGEVVIVPESAAAAADARNAQSVDRSINTATVRAARLATWVWDGCVLVGANVDTTIGVGGGSSGGGGGGDASAANQVTAIEALNDLLTNLGDVDVNLEALETLVTALGANTDTLEALLAKPTIVVEPFTADESIAAANWLRGYSLRNEADDAVAQVTIHNGNDATDPVLCYVNLAASESPTVVFPERLPAPDGVFVEVVAGSVVGSVYYEA